MELKNSIVRIDNIFNSYLIKRIVDYINFEEINNLTVLTGESTARRVKGFITSPHLEINKQNVSKKLFFNLICKAINVYHLNYSVMFRHLTLGNVNQIDFLKYDKNGKYDIHVDQCPSILEEKGERPRLLTTIINLNEEYKGGDFVFYNPTNNEVIRKEKLKTGSVIMFPSNFLFPHSIEPITEGVRYSLVCWNT